MSDADLVLTEPEVAELLRCTPASVRRRRSR